MITEKDAIRFLTRERQWCIQCWSQGIRTRIVHVGERPALGEKAYKAKRRRLLTQHLKAAHPEVWGGLK